MSNTMHNQTVPLMWIAFYDNGECLPQFDLNTGSQHLFKEIDQSKLSSFGWFPITPTLIDKIPPLYYYDPKLTPVIIDLKPDQRIIALRRESISSYTGSLCLECGFKWQWIPKPDLIDGSIGDAGLPRYGEKYCFYEINNNGRREYEVICPKCFAKNNIKCPDCNEWWDKTQDESSKGLAQDQWTYHLECPVCKKVNEKRIQSINGSIIKCVFMLGWQKTLPNGSNKKMIILIKPDPKFGSKIILSDDFENGGIQFGQRNSNVEKNHNRGVES